MNIVDTLLEASVFIVPVLVVGVIVIYFINRKRADRYITYADYNEYRTSGGRSF